jgi:Cof subfamily protein (haloacid dehalogenase superfamily)
LFPRLIATDLDGTLLRSDGSVSPRTRTALQRVRAAGVELVLVTGRPARRVGEISEALALDGKVICANGAVLYDLATRTIVKQTQLTASVALALIKQLRAALPDICFAVETGVAIGREPAYARHRPPSAANAAIEVADALELAARGAVKLIAMHPTLPLDQFLVEARAIVAERASVTHAGSPFLEIAAAGVTKAWALAAHCESLGITAAEVLAFGDMPNDLPMLEWSGRAVAVANAHPSVLAATRDRADSNDEDGVARYIEQLFERA